MKDPAVGKTCWRMRCLSWELEDSESKVSQELARRHVCEMRWKNWLARQKIHTWEQQELIPMELVGSDERELKIKAEQSLNNMLKMVFKKGSLAGMSCLVGISLQIKVNEVSPKLLQKSRYEIIRASGIEGALDRSGELALVMLPSRGVYTYTRL